MKNYFVKQWDEICAVEDSSELYRIFMRVQKVLCLVGLVIQACVFVYLFGGAGFSPEGMFLYSGMAAAAGLTVGVLFLLQYAERAIEQNKFKGSAIGLILSLLAIPHWYFPLGIFGLYCFLNPGYQKKHMANAPKAFVVLLALVHLNFTGQQASKEAEVPSPEKINS